MKKFLKIVGIVFLVIILLFIIIVALLIIKSNVWANNFQSNIQSDYLVNNQSESEDLFNEKIQKYILSNSTTDFISFTPNEVSQIVYDSLKNMIGDSSIDISNVYVKPEKGVWEVCGFVFVKEYKSLSGWICADVTKDNMQTAQLYVQKLTVQGINITAIYPSLLVKINQGIAEALFTANENGFVGRVFENIELQDNQIIIKGSLY